MQYPKSNGFPGRLAPSPFAAPNAARGAETSRSRIHLSLPDTLLSRLQEIQRDTHANSLTEVVKAALQLYAAAVAEHKKGVRLYFKDDEGHERQLALFI
jgi:hypothetical protein